MGGQQVKSYTPHCYYSRCKVQLVWVKLLTSNRLSLNVVREVCTYLDSLQPLLAVTRHQVQQCNYAAKSWQPTRQLSLELPLTNNIAFVHLGEEKFFACGGMDSNFAYSRKVFLVENEIVSVLPEMMKARSCVGLFFDKVRKEAFVFGGFNSGRPLRSAETFASKKWSELSDMLSPRALFNPCSHGPLIYLCGGRTTSVETYSLETQEYTSLPCLPESARLWDCTAVILDYNLVAISGDSVWTCTLSERKVTTAYTPGRYHMWSNCPPVVFYGIVYFIGYIEEKAQGGLLRPVCRALDVKALRWLDEVV